MQDVFKKIIDLLKEKQQLHNANAEELKSKNKIGLTAIAEARELGFNEAIKIVKKEAKEYNNGWISVEDRLPEDCDNRFYMCIVENHEEDLPMFCQYDEEYGFGFWQDFYDEHTLGFVDSEFKTNEELGYEKVIAWQPRPEPYQIQSITQITNQSTWKKQTMRRFEKVE